MEEHVDTQAEVHDISAETADALEARGHEIRDMESIGKVNAVRWRGDGTVTAAADPRGPGTALILNPAPG